MMKFIPLPLEGACLIEPEPANDPRGSFSRLYCRKEMGPLWGNAAVAQINRSLNRDKGTLRGLHYRVPPGAEKKIIMCVRGAVFDVIVDLGKGSESFLKWHGEIISAGNMRMISIPGHFAHGFQTLEDDSMLVYFHSKFYEPLHERVIRYDDPRINIKWPLTVSSLSERDRCASQLSPDFPGLP